MKIIFDNGKRTEIDVDKMLEKGMKLFKKAKDKAKEFAEKVIKEVDEKLEEMKDSLEMQHKFKYAQKGREEVLQYFRKYKDYPLQYKEILLKGDLEGQINYLYRIGKNNIKLV
jgi:vacuolar-type H+-ATPase subunit H